MPLDLSWRVEKYIDSPESQFSANDHDEHDKEDALMEKRMLLFGRSLLKITNNIDKTLGGMILNTYINCLLLGTTTLYAGSSVFFNKSTGISVYFISCGCFSLTILSILRLMYHTNAGQCLASSMEMCAETLNEIQMITKVKDQKSAQIKLLKQDIKDKCVSPINPFSAFSLSNSTLIGTFATILTYLIVLIQFKAAEDEEKTKLLIDIKEMIQNNMKNSSNDTSTK